MAEAPYQTYERVTGKKWTGGTSPEVASYLQQYGISAPAGSAEANLSLQKALSTQSSGSPRAPSATLQATGSLLEPSLTSSGSGTPTPSNTGSTAPVPDNALTGEIVDEQPIDSASILKSRYGIDTSSFDFLTQPERSIKDITMEVMNQTGLGEIQSRIQGYTKEIETLENERNQKIAEINENPWLTEQLRQNKVDKLTNQYEGKINARVNRLNLEKSTLDDAREQINFAVQQAYSEASKTRELRINSLQDLMDRAEAEAKAQNELRVSKGNLSQETVGGFNVLRDSTGKVINSKEIQAPGFSDKYGTGIVGEYNFYAEQEKGAGRSPMSFNDYQTMDANRKNLAAGGVKTQVVEVGGRKLLIDTNSGVTIKDLGPATTSATDPNKPLSGDAAKVYSIATTIMPELDTLRGILASADRTKLALILSGADTTTARLIDSVADKVGRIRSGGAINTDEAASFKSQLIRQADLLSGNTQSALDAIDSFKTEAESISHSIRPQGGNTGGEQFELNGVIYIDDGTGNFIPKADGGTGQVSVANVKKVAEAIGKFESGGSYTIRSKTPSVRPDGSIDWAYGKYQVMGANIPSWTKEALGKSLTIQQFLADPKAQDAVAYYKMGKMIEQYGNLADVASIWFSGKPLAKAGNAKDSLGTTVPSYVKNVQSIYNQLG